MANDEGTAQIHDVALEISRLVGFQERKIRDATQEIERIRTILKGTAGWKNHRLFADAQVEELRAEIARLQDAKRQALAIADVRSKEAVALRLENERLRAKLSEQKP